VLLIVLALVVLLTGLTVAYLSRTTNDRQAAHVSFHQTNADQVAASATDIVIGGLRQEITGPSPTPPPPYVPAANTNMVPLRSGNPAGNPDPVPNLIRRSVDPDNILAPGVPSYASAINSAPADPANPKRGDVSLARWNKHYLVPKSNPNDNTADPIAAFIAPDWIILTRGPRDGTTTFPVRFDAWEAALADPTSTNNLYAIGRFAYAIYDEGGLLDANVAGYPNGTTPDQRGRKGSIAYADLTTLPYPLSNAASPYQVDTLVGWRNYGTTQPSNTFPGSTFAANFRSGSAPATSYWTSIINSPTVYATFIPGSATGFLSASTAQTNGRSDQMFLSRQQLIAYRTAANFPASALQYLGTFLRESNAPSWKPFTPSAINPNLLNVLVPGSNPTQAAFTRADGTTAFQGDLLIKQRFPLSRINGLGPNGPVTTLNTTIANGFVVPASTLVPDPSGGSGNKITTVQRDFGLVWNSDHWDYVGAFKNNPVQNAIERLDQVALENREPNFFELLKAGILNGSVGVGSNGATFVAAEAK